jgi:hypothetical protein
VPDDILSDIVRRQQSAGFPDLAGAEASITLPVSDRLINEIISAKIAPGAAIRDVQIRSHEANEIVVSFQVARGSFNFAVTLTLVVDEQPVLPHQPVLGLRLAKLPGVLSLAAPMLRFFDALPPGVSLEGQRVRLNLRTLLANQGRADWLDYVTSLQITTRPDAVVLTARAAIDPSRTHS